MSITLREDVSNSQPIAVYNTRKGLRTVNFIEGRRNEDSKYQHANDVINKDAYISRRELSKMSRSYLDPKDLEDLYQAIINQDVNLIKNKTPRLLKMFETGSYLFNDRFDKEFHTNREISVIPPFIPDGTKDRLTAYISGPSGAGKSTFCAHLVRTMIKLQPYLADKILLFSRNPEPDPAFEGLPILKVKLDDTYQSNPIYREECVDSICIFDDIDTLPKVLQAFVADLRADLLETGRHLNCHVLTTSHQTCNFGKTKIVISESKIHVMYPRSGNRAGYTRLMKNYLGLDNKTIDRLLNLESRWIALHTSHPRYCVSEHDVILL